MNTFDHSWALDPVWCPCDVHFVEFIEERSIDGATIFHFGTGAHHHVGIKCAEGALDNVVLGITASRTEHEAYEELVIARPAIARRYIAYFGDIYLFNPRLIPQLDIATLFHLCEFRTEKNAAYGALTDLELLTLVTGRVRPGGHLFFYKGSCAIDRAAPMILENERHLDLVRVEDYKSLVIYKKSESR